MDPDEAELFDVGAQAERTALAWQRTGIGLMAAGALVVRWTVTERFPPWPGASLVAFGAFASLVLARQRYRRVLQRVRAGETPLSRYLIPSTAAFMVAVVVAMIVGVSFELAHL